MRFACVLLLASCAQKETPPPKLEVVHFDPPSEPAREAPKEAGATLPPLSDHEVITLTVGQIKTIDTHDIRNYSVGGPAVDVRLTPDGTKFVIVGKAKGRADLLLIDKHSKQEIITFEVQ